MKKFLAIDTINIPLMSGMMYLNAKVEVEAKNSDEAFEKINCWIENGSSRSEGVFINGKSMSIDDCMRDGLFVIDWIKHEMVDNIFEEQP